MRQMSLAQQAEFQRFAKKSRQEQFLEEMDAVMPWAELLALVEPYYPKVEMERPPVGLGIMLRLYFVQHWFALSDPAAEDALYDSAALRRFVGKEKSMLACGKPGLHKASDLLSRRWMLEIRAELDHMHFCGVGAVIAERAARRPLGREDGNRCVAQGLAVCLMAQPHAALR